MSRFDPDLEYKTRLESNDDWLSHTAPSPSRAPTFASRFYRPPRRTRTVKRRPGYMTIDELKTYLDGWKGVGKWKCSGCSIEYLRSDGTWQIDYYEVRKRGQWYYIDPGWCE